MSFTLPSPPLSGNTVSLGEINKKWALLSDTDKSTYRAEAAAVEAVERSTPLSSEQKALKIRKHLRQLQMGVCILSTVNSGEP